MRFKSKAKGIVEEAIKREYEYLSSQEVGTEAYNESQKRLIALEGKLAELEGIEMDSKDRFVKFCLEVAKVVAGVVVPVGCLVFVTAQEREITYTGAARMLLNCVIPGGKKLF